MRTRYGDDRIRRAIVERLAREEAPAADERDDRDGASAGRDEALRRGDSRLPRRAEPDGPRRDGAESVSRPQRGLSAAPEAAPARRNLTHIIYVCV